MINIGEQDQSPQNETENTEKRKPGPLDEKEKIRARYAGTDGVTLIPARLQPGLLEDMQASARSRDLVVLCGYLGLASHAAGISIT